MKKHYSAKNAYKYVPMTFERRLRSSLWKCTDLMQMHEKRYRELEVRKEILKHELDKIIKERGIKYGNATKQA